MQACTMSFVSIESALEFINNCSELVNYEQLANAFRYLRNACVDRPAVQNRIVSEEDVVNNIYRILFGICQEGTPAENKVVCLQIGMQLIANILVGNLSNQEKIWTVCKDLLYGCLEFSNVKVQNCSAMIFYNILLGHNEYLSNLDHPYSQLIQLTLNESTSEFAIYTLELFLLKSENAPKIYDELVGKDRLIVLEILLSLINKSDIKISSELIKFFVDFFTKNSDCILKTVSRYAETLDPIELVKVLEVLAAFSSDNEHYYLKILQKETSLLINCLLLLKCVHSISKENGNNFSMLQKISDLDEVEKNTPVQEHPAFGFKCALIKIIGNMCWKNSSNQNKVRELDCLPVLLDCCNIDGRNPFIIQWTILAIRNVCEKNIENQKVIASMSKQGVVDTAKLREMGLTVDLDSNVSLAPLKRDQ